MIRQTTIDEISSYETKEEAPSDFDQFWKKTLAEQEKYNEVNFSPQENFLKLVKVFHVEFAGYGGEKISGWFLLPNETTGKIPCIVEFLGYGGGYGNYSEHLFWANAGYAHFIMDTRGQGSGWEGGRGSAGNSGDSFTGSSNHPGYLTRGIENPTKYYYRRVFTDAVHAIAAVANHPYIDTESIVLRGTSQGGGIALAASGLLQHRIPDLKIQGLLCNTPFLSHYRLAVEEAREGPYLEIVKYCQWRRTETENVFRTLAYFDMIHFAERVNLPALFSVGLRDWVCPPRTAFAVFRRMKGKKEMKIWNFNSHEGGEHLQLLEEIRFLEQLNQKKPC